MGPIVESCTDSPQLYKLPATIDQVSKLRQDFLLQINNPIVFESSKKLPNLPETSTTNSLEIFSTCHNSTESILNSHETLLKVYSTIQPETSLSFIIHQNFEVIDIELFKKIQEITHQKNFQIRELVEQLIHLKNKFSENSRILQKYYNSITEFKKTYQALIQEVQNMFKPVLGKGETIKSTDKFADKSSNVSKSAVLVQKQISEDYNCVVEKINYKHNLINVVVTSSLKSQLERKLQNSLRDSFSV